MDVDSCTGRQGGPDREGHILQWDCLLPFICDELGGSRSFALYVVVALPQPPPRPSAIWHFARTTTSPLIHSRTRSCQVGAGVSLCTRIFRGLRAWPGFLVHSLMLFGPPGYQASHIIFRPPGLARPPAALALCLQAPPVTGLPTYFQRPPGLARLPRAFSWVVWASWLPGFPQSFGASGPGPISWCVCLLFFKVSRSPGFPLISKRPPSLPRLPHALMSCWPPGYQASPEHFEASGPGPVSWRILLVSSKPPGDQASRLFSEASRLGATSSRIVLSRVGVLVTRLPL